MTGTENGGEGPPWHFWAIAVLALLWYASGAYTTQMAQLGRLDGISPGEVAYYAAKPAWLVATTALATYGSLVGAALLLLRRQLAVPVFRIAFAAILFNTAVELANGTSRAYANNVAAVVTVIIVAIAAFMVFYARAMRTRGVLA